MNRLRQTLALAFPYLFLLAAIGVLVWGHARRGRDNATGATGSTSHTDPVCHMTVAAGLSGTYEGKTYSFCTAQCRAAFEADPLRYLVEDCMVCRSEGRHMAVDSAKGYPATWEGKTYRFCSPAHRAAFQADPAGFFMHTMWGIPNWLYYASIALVLIVSFGLFEWHGARERRSDRPRIPPAAERRLDLFRLRALKRILPHPATRLTVQLIFVGAFAMIIAAGLFGDQLPGRNVAPLLTWTVWWGGLVWLILYCGKAWCYACPWNSLADWAEGAKFGGKSRRRLTLGLKWPRLMRNIWPATILFVGLTWIELGFGVTMNPRFTAWLGLGMLGLAFVSAFIFDRKSFCRYGCLVGRVSGLYALFSPVEIRSKDKSVCQTCAPKTCYTGNEKGDPCPTFEVVGTMKHNTYCIACLECVKTCKYDNVALNLRPWGADLQNHARPRSDEAYLALLMLAITGFHGLTMTAKWQTLSGRLAALPGVGEVAAFSLGMAAVMLFPILIYAVLIALSRLLGGGGALSYRDYFIRYAYAVLPIALFYHLAHNSEHLLMEGQKVVALLSDPMGRNWNLFHTAGWDLPPLTDLSTLWLIQAGFVLTGHVYSLWVARRVAVSFFNDRGAALRSQLPMLLAMILFSVMSLWLLKQPMQMRTSSM